MRDLERAPSAEAAGINFAAAAALAEEWVQCGVDWQSFMLLRNGKVACEAYREPFRRSDVHMAYSISKSFFAVAYGFALEEGLLTETTRLLDVFPELRGSGKDPYLESLTIDHLISMTAGKRTHRPGKHPLHAFVKAKWDFAPGSDWRYVNENYVVAAEMLTRVAGMSVTEYLTPRLYEPLEMEVPVWEKSANGVEFGGWGLMLTTEDIAKFLLCVQNGGRLFGRQIIPEAFLRRATAKLNETASSQADRDSAAGYGLGFWQCAGYPGAVRCEGLYSQYGIMFPNEDACLVLTAGGPYLQKTLDTLWQYTEDLFIEPQTGRQDAASSPERFPAFTPSICPVVSSRSPMEKEIDGRVYRLSKPHFVNACGYPVGMFPMQTTFFSAEKGGNLDRLCFRFSPEHVTVSWQEKHSPDNTVVLPLDGSYAVNTVKIGDLQLDCAGFAFWSDDHTLEVVLRPIPSVSARRFIICFHGHGITIYPRTLPDLSERVKPMGEKLGSVLKGKYFEWWIHVLTPRVEHILQPTLRGYSLESQRLPEQETEKEETLVNN